MDPRPCDSAADLLAWEPPGVGHPRPVVNVTAGDANLPCHPTEVPPIEKLRPGPIRKRQPQLMVIHDYKGDFPACDRWDGCPVSECPPFLFTHWWNMDAFVYFGNKMVTIPPPAFTSLAHRHGVRVMGTLRFEDNEAKEQLISHILSSEETINRTIDQLVMIMKTWGFEGWLVCVKGYVETERDGDLGDFFTLLNERTMEADPCGSVWWYDPANSCLGKKESRDSADFYNWRLYNLNIVEASRLNLKEISANCAGSVCIGVDVHGRAMPPNNMGWDTHWSIQHVFKRGPSVALFAPGWAVEAEENRGADPAENSLRFWSSLSGVMNTRPLNFFPFKTTFCNGFSQNGKFFRLRDMDLMPHLAHSKGLLIPSERGLVVKKEGKHLLWVVKSMRSTRDLRVKIRVEGPGTVKIMLDRREMVQHRKEEDGTMVLRPMTGECLSIKTIHVVTSEPCILLRYFEACNVETDRCLE